MTSKYYLPSKIGLYLNRLQNEYSLSSSPEAKVLSRVLSTSRFYIQEGTSFDNWNGGITGHKLNLYLPLSFLRTIKIREQPKLLERLKEDLNLASSAIENEFIENVYLEPEEQENVDYQQSRKPVEMESAAISTDGIWEPGYLRLFISHRDEQKVPVRELSDALRNYGISGFVAHESIAPMSSWQTEILKALQTMEVMLAVIEPTFHDSCWTNQEVGFAIGKDVRIISLKISNVAPKGFIASN